MIDIYIQILTTFFRALVNIQFINTFLKNQPKPSIKNLFLILGFMLLSTLSLIFYPNQIYIYFITNSVFIFLFAFFQKGILQTKIIASTALLVFTVLCDSLFHTGIEYILNSSIPYYILNITISATIFIVSNIFSILISNYPLKRISFRKTILIIASPLISLIVFLLNYISNNNPVITLSITMLLLILNMFIFYFYDLILKYTNMEYENSFLELSNESYKSQLKIINNNREETLRLRHDIHNHILAMKLLISNQEYLKLSEHISSMANHINEKHLYSVSKNTTIDALLNYKLSLISNLKTEIKCNINIPNEDFMSLFDLTIIFGNLLDNIYDALEDAPIKKLNLDISYEKGVLFINSKNTFSTSPIILDKNFISLKKDKALHGYGIKNIKKVVDKYNGEYQNKLIKGYFVTEIMLFTNNKKI